MIKEKIIHIWQWVFKGESLEEKALNGVLGFFVIGEIPATIIAYQSKLYADAISAFIWFLTCLIFLFFPSKIRVKNYWVIFILGNISVAYAWMNYGGVEKAPIYFHLIVINLTAIVTKSTLHKWYFSALALILGSLFYIDFNHPHFISYPDIELNKLKIDNAYTIINVMAAFAFGMYFFKRAFDKLRDNLNSKNIQLTKINQEKTDFFTNLAHETKTPLTLISNYLDKYIKENGIDPDLEVIQRNIGKLKDDMINFLDSEKISRGKALYDHQQITNLSELLTNKSTLIKEWLKNKALNFSVETSSDLFVQCDPAALDRVINNLIDNAVKYSKKNGSIHVKSEKTEGKIHLEIIDDGEGIDQEELKNIFTPYYQISHKKMNSQGIGLGLSITKGILEEIGGTIVIQSEVNNYTKAVITLPYSNDKTLKQTLLGKSQSLTSPANVISTKSKEQKGRLKTSGKHILLVEDNDDMRSYLNAILDEHFKVSCAINGEDALQILNRHKPLPNIVLTDVMMDVMDGYTFISHLRANERLKTIPVIFLSAKSDNKDRLEGYSKGAIDFINKPFSADELIAKLLSISEQQEEQKETLVKKVVDMLGHADQMEKVKATKSDSFQENCKTYNISKREIDVVKLLKEGETRKGVAGKLNISEKTVARHIDNMFDKTDANNKTELINKLFG